jgi:hypothetical protein
VSLHWRPEGLECEIQLPANLVVVNH